MKSKLSTLAIVLLACFTLLNFSLSAQSLNQSKNLETLIKDNPDKIVYVQAKDGKNPIKGVDYFDGANGINAMSFNVTNNVIKEVPLIGAKGEKGDSPECLIEVNKCRGNDGTSLQYNFNDSTGNFEVKETDDDFWQIAISCEKFKTGCPDDNK